MVVDTSAVIERVLNGPRAKAIDKALELVREPKMISTVSWVECHIVVRRKFGEDRYEQTARDLAALLRGLVVQIEPVSVVQAQIAIDGFKKYGKGSGGAALNFGDCFAYALARHLDDALLFVGDDFRKTDVKIALK